jgi:peptidyl-prolyl cis-trans isomerase D
MAAVVGFLIISFAIWGIGDIFRGFGRGTVATIGHTEITADRFRQLYNERLQQLGRQLNRPISSDQARALGLDQQLLGQLIAEAALDERARDLRLGISDAEVARRITEEEAFRGASGQFDRARFEQLIRQAGYNEQTFVQEQRRNALRRQLAFSLSGDIKPPKVASDAMAHYQNEQRTIDYVVLDRAQAGTIPPPSEDVLTKYFDDHKVLFRAPEFRKATILSIQPEDIARGIEVSADDIKTYYERNAARFSTPEKRQIQQIVFPNRDEAHKAAERLAGGLSFDDLAKERGLSPKDIDLGLVAKSDLADRKVADAAFSLQARQTSAAIDGVFGGTIVHVTKIEPGYSRSLSEVEPEIKHILALDRAKADIRKIRDKVDEEIGGGARLDEVGKKLNLPVRAIEAIDRSGRGPDGQPINLPKGVDLLTGIFSTEIGIENDTLQTPDGGLVWYDLVAITPSRERTLDEVKDQVIARWRDDETIARLTAKAEDMIQKMKGGASLAEVAAASKLKVATAKDIKRGDNPDALSAATVAAVFRTGKGEPAVAEGKEPTQRILFVVTDIKVPALDASSADAKRLTDALRNALSEDLLNQYLARLQSDLGASVNQSALAQAIGGSSN